MSKCVLAFILAALVSCVFLAGCGKGSNYNPQREIDNLHWNRYHDWPPA